MATLYPKLWRIFVDNLEVTALDCEFKVTATLKPEPNKCTLVLWNVNPDHRAQLMKRNRPNGADGKIQGVRVRIEAGYVNNTTVIFDGDLREVNSSRVGTDWRTTLTGDDGGRSYREARIIASFRAGASVGSIIKQCADAMGIGIGNASTFEADAQIAGYGATLPGPIVLDGSAAKALDRVLKSVGLTWSIQRGALQVLKKGTPLSSSAILLTPDTGLLNSPEATIDASSATGNAQQSVTDAAVAVVSGKAPKAAKPKTPHVLKLKTMMIPGIVPGRKVTVKSATFNGGYYLTECEYTGQSWASTWEIDCVARGYT